MSVNYLLATWAGPKRRNPSTEYLKVHLDKLASLHHNIDQVTIIRPAGSDNEEFYNVDLNGAVLINRPTNDRSYGQFFYGYQRFPGFDHYILAEDDYLPMVDNFDSILIEMLKDKRVDYLCGKYHAQNAEDPLNPEQNIGIVKGEALRMILEANPEPYFPVNGLDDGSEKILFAKLFTDLGLTIADYSDRYSIPYWDRFLRYFTTHKHNPLFSPYQLEYGKAFTYDWANGETPADLNSHYLMDIVIGEDNSVIVEGENIGSAVRSGNEFLIMVNKFGEQIADRVRYIHRAEQITTRVL